MATVTLIMGESGTGKSTSLRNLDPKETFIISALDKPLPFRGFKSKYFKSTKEKLGNYSATDNCERIIKGIESISETRPDIKNIVIDDFQYVMSNDYMRRAKEAGFAKFLDAGVTAWKIPYVAQSARDDLFIFILTHTETDSSGVKKCKTIGKMVDEKITLEGMFTVVFHSLVFNNQYQFLTQHDGAHIAKSPMGMFDDLLIDNDLAAIKQKMVEYFNE